MSGATQREAWTKKKHQKENRVSLELSEPGESVHDLHHRHHHVPHQHADEPEAADQRGRRQDQEGRQALRTRLLQEQGPLLETGA